MKKKRKEIICRWDADAYFTASSGLLLHAENDLDRERQRGWLGVQLQAVHLLPLPLFFASSSLLRLCKGKTGLSVCSSQSSGYYSFAVRLQHPLALSTVYGYSPVMVTLSQSIVRRTPRQLSSHFLTIYLIMNNNVK